jgi:ankyrin repeat protein
MYKMNHLNALLFVLLSVMFIAAYGNTERQKGPSIATGVLTRNIEEIRQALNLGEDINSELQDGSNGLHLAVWSAVSLNAIKPVLEYLLEKGAKINALNQNGKSALHMAVLADKVEIVQFLVGT